MHKYAQLSCMTTRVVLAQWLKCFHSINKGFLKSECYLPDKMGAEYRLLVVSSRARNKVAIFNSVLPNLILVDYNYETTSLEELLEKITKALNGTKVASMAMVLHTSERELFICGPGPAFLSLKALINDAKIKDFLQALGNSVLDMV